MNTYKYASVWINRIVIVFGSIVVGSLVDIMQINREEHQVREVW